MSGMDKLIRKLDNLHQKASPGSIQLHQAIVQSVDALSGSAEIVIAGQSYPRVKWIHPQLFTPKEGTSVWVFSNGERGKDYMIWGPTS